MLGNAQNLLCKDKQILRQSKYYSCYYTTKLLNVQPKYWTRQSTTNPPNNSPGRLNFQITVSWWIIHELYTAQRSWRVPRTGATLRWVDTIKAYWGTRLIINHPQQFIWTWFSPHIIILPCSKEKHLELHNSPQWFTHKAHEISQPVSIIKIHPLHSIKELIRIVLAMCSHARNFASFFEFSRK